MSFKESKTYKNLIKIGKITLIIVIISMISTIIGGLLQHLKFIEALALMFSSTVANLLFFVFPISFIYLSCTIVDEFVKSEYKTKKTLFKIIAVNFLPVTALVTLFILSDFLNPTTGTYAEISYIIAIPCYVFLFISIPLSIIFLISSIVEDLIKKFKK